MSDTDFVRKSTLSRAERDALLEQAAQELDILLGGNLGSGGSTKTATGKKIRSLKKDRIYFPNEPQIELITREKFQELKQNAPLTIDQLLAKYNFYWVPVPIILETQSWVFSKFWLHLTLSADNAPSHGQPLTYRIYPEEKSVTTEKGDVALGGSVGVNAHADANLEPQHIDAGVAQAGIGGGAEAKLHFRAGLEITKSWEKTKAVIKPDGLNTIKATLDIDEALQKSPPVGLIVQLPKKTRSLKIDAEMEAYHKNDYAPNGLIEVFSKLSKQLQNLFLGGIPTSATLETPWDLTPQLIDALS